MKRAALIALAAAAAAVVLVAVVLPVLAQQAKAPPAAPKAEPAAAKAPANAPAAQRAVARPVAPADVLEAAKAAGLDSTETNALQEYIIGRRELERGLIAAWATLSQAAADKRFPKKDMQKQLKEYQAKVEQLRTAEGSLADALGLDKRPRLAAALTLAGLLDNGLGDLNLERRR